MPRLLLVGNPRPTHVGRHFLNAAQQLGWEVQLVDVEPAFSKSVWLRRLSWHLLGRRPGRLNRFSSDIVAECQDIQPDWVLTTGLAPIHAKALHQLHRTGVQVVNFLTDDPWNPAHRAPWFMQALPHYAHVFSPRHANLPDLVAHGVKAASYLPFAYAPEEHHPPESLSEADHQRWGHLVAFIGGADPDRAAIIRSLVQNDIPVGLWGGYWNRYPDLAPYAHGHADAETCRRIVASAGANLCLVRQANRDGHSMRSYEMAAIGGALLVEDTADHRRLFDQAATAAFSFDSVDSLVRCAHQALALPRSERQAMANSVRQGMGSVGNRYADRLLTLQQTLSPCS